MSGYLGIPRDKIRTVPLGINTRRPSPRRAPRTRRRRSRSATSRASRRRRACTCWPRRIAGCARGPGSARRGCWRRLPARRASVVSRRRQGARWRTGASADQFEYRGRARSRRQDCASSRASTSCRCRRPTTSRRASSCSRRWRAACRSCSRAAARSRRSSNGPAAACSSTPDDPDALADGLLALLARSAIAPPRSASAGAAGVREHYSVGRMAEAAEAVYRRA